MNALMAKRFKTEINRYGFKVYAEGNKVTVAKEIKLAGLGGPELIPVGTKLPVAHGFRPTTDEIHCVHPLRSAVSFWVRADQISEKLPARSEKRVAA